jgi:hypothetical protein
MPATNKCLVLPIIVQVRNPKEEKNIATKEEQDRALVILLFSKAKLWESFISKNTTKW